MHENRGDVGGAEEQQQLRRTADDVLPGAGVRHRLCQRVMAPHWQVRIGQARGLQRPRQPLDRGLLVDVPHRDREASLSSDPGTEVGHQERVRAQVVEEVAVSRHPLDPEYGGQRVSEDLLGSGRWCRARVRCAEEPGARGRQVLAVRLVAGQHRDHCELLKVRRDHVDGEPLTQVLIHERWVQAGAVLAQAVVGDELDEAGCRLIGVDHCLGDFRDLQDQGFDLGELDAVAADLDLGVDAPVVLDLTVLVDPPKVTGSVDAAPRVVRDPDEVGNEGPRRQVVPVHVAASQPDPRDTDLAELSGMQGSRLVGIKDHD